MIYRHYKGGLYCVIGYATRFSETYPAKSVEVRAEAKSTDTLEKITVYTITDVINNNTYYAFDNDKLEGIHVLYKDLNGDFWLREREEFSSNVNVIVNEGDDYITKVVPRFEDIRREVLFDEIIKLRNNFDTTNFDKSNKL